MQIVEDGDGSMVSSEKLLEFFSRHVTVVEYLTQQPRPNCFSGVHRHNGHSAVGMSQAIVAAPDPYDLESSLG